MLRLPSIGHLAGATAEVARRFPEVVACAVIAGCAGVVAVGPGAEERWWALLGIASLGIPLFIALTLAGERRQWTGGRRVLSGALGLAILAALYLVLDPWADEAPGQRYGHLTLTLHLAVGVAPYIAVAEPHGFWQYNHGTAEIEPWYADGGDAAGDTAVAPAEGDGRVDRALDLPRVVPELPGRPVRLVARRDGAPLTARGFDRLVATDMDVEAVLLRRESAAR
ncbi:MAG: hypothetical protein OXN18_16205 [Gemmatimonadota bacterium]|nr:hypothetical protein [Gemmatimonadota bacterium]